MSDLIVTDDIGYEIHSCNKCATNHTNLNFSDSDCFTMKRADRTWKADEHIITAAHMMTVKVTESTNKAVIGGQKLSSNNSRSNSRS